MLEKPMKLMHKGVNKNFILQSVENNLTTFWVVARKQNENIRIMLRVNNGSI